jgi:nicotinamide-nucleotide amidase
MGAEIITIGTELLLGEILDTNTRLIARSLRSIGLDLYRTTTVGDNVARIAQAVGESLARAEAVLTTGGLGPTVDDPTREAIALALGVPTEFRPELWEQIQERFARFRRPASENNRRQAFIPRGAVAIENSVGTAPAFRAETDGSVVIALPGVPAELEVLLETEVLPYLRRRLKLQAVIHARVLHAAGVGESWLDERIADLETQANPTVGIAAHPGLIDVRITAKAPDAGRAASSIAAVEATIRERLGEAIFGADDETLGHVVLDHLHRRHWRLVVVEQGTSGRLVSSLEGHGDSLLQGEVVPEDGAPDMDSDLHRLRVTHDAEVALGLSLRREGNVNRARIVLSLPGVEDVAVRTYGGPAANAATWAANLALDHLRRKLI